MASQLVLLQKYFMDANVLALAFVAIILICLKDAGVSESTAIIQTKICKLEKNTNRASYSSQFGSLCFLIFCKFLLFLSGFGAVLSN
jgi:hypothetical protein